MMYNLNGLGAIVYGIKIDADKANILDGILTEDDDFFQLPRGSTAVMAATSNGKAKVLEVE